MIVVLSIPSLVPAVTLQCLNAIDYDIECRFQFQQVWINCWQAGFSDKTVYLSIYLYSMSFLNAVVVNVKLITHTT